MFRRINQRRRRGSCGAPAARSGHQKGPQTGQGSGPWFGFSWRDSTWPDTRVCHTLRMSRPQWRPCLPERLPSSDSIRSRGIKDPPGGTREGRTRTRGRESMGACGDALPCIMAADFHPTSSSGAQVDGNGQIQPVRGCRGRA